jgi:hypothetical protein
MAGSIRLNVVVGALLGVMFAPGSAALSANLVPNSLSFWDFSKNWTTNYGPAYRDTNEGTGSFVPCSGRYALCFHSGPEPLPCKADHRGRFANCTCTIENGTNYVLISGILNYKVYLETVEKCGVDGSDCSEVDSAPVCKAIAEGKLIPGAEVISTYHPDVVADFDKLLTGASDAPPVTACPKGPYAGCMTAPCKETRSGDAVCTCPIFWGPFQLTGAGASCTLDDDLVNSASYTPVLDKANAGAGQ